MYLRLLPRPLGVSADAGGALVMLYDGAHDARRPADDLVAPFHRRRRDWSARTALSAAGEFASFPAMESAAPATSASCTCRQDGGPDAWNVWYRAPPTAA